MSTICETPADKIKANVADGYRLVAPGWHKWRREFKAAGAALTEAILAASRPRPGMRILDIGCGAGEPALTFAPLIMPMGYLAATDLVPEMLKMASTAAGAGGHSNIWFGVADGESLPFANEAFDLIISRNAIMHFPAPWLALREAYRVLRPGGRAVFSALGRAEESPAQLTTINVLLRYAPPQKTAGLGQDVYKFGVPGTLAALFASAGFEDIHEELLTTSCPWPGNAVHFWQALPEHAWNFRKMLEGLAPDARERATAEAIAALRQYENDGTLHLTAPVVIVSGMRRAEVVAHS